MSGRKRLKIKGKKGRRVIMGKWKEEIKSQRKKRRKRKNGWVEGRD